MLLYFLKILIILGTIIGIIVLFSKLCDYMPKEERQKRKKEWEREQERLSTRRSDREEVERNRGELLSEIKDLDIESIRQEQEIVQYIEKYQHIPEITTYIDIIWNGIEEVPGLKGVVGVDDLKKISSDANSKEIYIDWDQEGMKNSYSLNWKYKYAGISNVYDENKQLALVIFVLRELDKKIQSIDPRVFSTHRLRITTQNNSYDYVRDSEISAEEAYKLKDSGKGEKIKYDAVINYGYIKTYKMMTEL